MKWKLIAFYCIAMLTLVVINPIGTTGADESNGSEANTKADIDIITSPQDVVFDVSNIKPGDVIQRTITIQNGGLLNFGYITEAKHTKGSEKLYDQLLLQFADGDGVLYSGPLSGFSGLDVRELASDSEEQLTLTVEFPYESGNEFQGLATEFEMKFYVDGTIDGGGTTPDGNTPSQETAGIGSTLPKTGETNPMIFFLTGLAIAILGVILYRKREALSLLLASRRREL